MNNMPGENPFDSVEKNYTILVVEDDIALNKLIQKSLQRNGIRTEGCYTGSDAIDFIKKSNRNQLLLLLDYQLYDMSGESLIHEINALKLQVPFVIITGHGDERTAVKMMKLGALDYMVKDSSFIELLPSVVSQVLGHLDIEKQLSYSINALKKSEEKYRSIFENIQDLYFELKPNGEVEELSPSVKNIFGRQKEFYLGKSFFSSHEEEQNFLNNLNDKGELIDYEVNIKNKDNEDLLCSITCKYIFDQDTNLSKIIGTLRNISERKQAEENIKLSEERYRFLADHSSDMISKHSWDRTYLYVSPASRKLLGYEPQDLIGQSAYFFIHPEDLENIRRNHIQLLESRENSFIEIYRIRKKNGEYIWFETNNQIIISKETQLLEEIVCVSRDITERIEKEQLLKAKEVAEAANQAKSEFLANMSHEIRNPLNAIIGMTKTLAKTHLEEDQYNYLNSILIASNNLLSILNDILDFSKIEANKIDVIYSNFQLDDLISEIATTFTAQAQLKGLSFSTEITGNMPSNFYGDEKKIKQILNNLVSNAVKFTNEGSVAINASCQNINDNDARVLIKVTDTGIGVKKQEIPLLFESFRQLDSSAKKEYQGTGLGLSIVKSLTDLLNGQISFESEPGKGSTVTVELPLVISSEKNIAMKEPMDDKKHEIKNIDLRILVAEDDAINQLYLASFLKSHGWKVDTASNGQTALDKFKANSYHLILMDGQMPRMDGFEATRKIREMERENQSNPVPIIAITGYAIAGDREKFLDAGMNDYISKPIDENLLLEKIQQFTSK